MPGGGGSAATVLSAMSEDEVWCLEMDFQAALRLRGGADGVVALAPLICVEEKSDPAPPDNAPSAAAVCEEKSEPAGAPPDGATPAVKKDVPAAVDQVLLFFLLLELYVLFYRLL